MSRRPAILRVAAVLAGMCSLPATPTHAQTPTTSAEADVAYLKEADIPRFALVISTVAYDDANFETASVANADKDADRIAKLLHAASFDPVVIQNPTGPQIRDTLTSLVQRQIRFENDKGLRPVLAVYFAGHGFSSDGQDYITGRDFRKEANIQSGVAISELVRLVSSSADLLVFNDACRTKLDASPTAVGESIETGGEAAPAGTISTAAKPDEARGFASDEVRSLMSFATQQGRIAKGFVGAADRSSPYSDTLADHILRQDLAFRDLLNRVRTRVVARTGRTQYPQVEDGGAAAGRFYLVTSAAERGRERTAWDDALATGDAETIEDFAQEHASSRYSAAARRWLAEHRKEPAT